MTAVSVGGVRLVARVPTGLDDGRGGPGALLKGPGEPVEYV